MFGIEKKQQKQSSFHVHYKQSLDDLLILVKSLGARIEFIEAKQKAGEELRAVTETKFEHYTEEIGELREMYKELSEQKKLLDIEFSKTTAVVKSIQPTELNKAINAGKSAQVVLEGKVGLLIRQHEKFKADFDHFEHKLKVFKGEDELIKIQEQTRRDLMDIRKINQVVGMHASKVENNFVKIKEKMSEAQTAVTELNSLKSELLSLQEKLTTIAEDISEETKAQAAAAPPQPLDAAKIAEIENSLHYLTDVTLSSLRKFKTRLEEFSVKLESLPHIESTIAKKSNENEEQSKE